MISPERVNKHKNEIGKTYANLTVIKISNVKFNNNGAALLFVECKCICGNICETRLASLKHRSKIQNCSCGCKQVKKKILPNGRSKEYIAYHSAEQRCNNPNKEKYKYYGGRGIEFRFTSFKEFYDHIGIATSINHSLDRIEPNGHYEIGNVRWATPTQQANNKIKQGNRYT